MANNTAPHDDLSDYVTEALTVEDIRDCVSLVREQISEDDYYAMLAERHGY